MIADRPRYLLDTNICIHIATHSPPQVRKRFARHAANELAMSGITLDELRFGAATSLARERAEAAVERLCEAITVSALPETAELHCGELLAALQRQVQPIGNNDCGLRHMRRLPGWC